MRGGKFLQKFRLYETRSKFYLVGRDKSRTLWRVLKIDRLESTDLGIQEDPTSYTENECQELLWRIHEGNRLTGGLKFVTKCYGIIGFMKFLGPYYMVIITRRRKVGTICGHDIYSIGKSEMIAIPCPIVCPNVANSRDENRSFIVSFCRYCVLPVVIPSLVLNNIKITSLLPFVSGVLDIDLLFIHVTLGPFSKYSSSFWCYIVIRQCALLVVASILFYCTVLYCIIFR